ncbi:MAG: serine/threonine-protein kinase [Myxococcota bacterium]
MGVEVGQILGERYRVVRVLGQGAMGTVYRVQHTEMDTPLALKLLRKETLHIPGIEERFQREARSMIQLDDPHIVRVTDFGRTDEGELFMVMELLEGTSLSVASQDMSPGLLLELIDQVLSALEHAHDRGMVHRDLKPDNIMVVERRGRPTAKILDFGLVKVLAASPEEAPNLTQSGFVFGTPRYMSPEQALGDAIDGRTDLYAVGVILYQALTGRVLFPATDMAGILRKHVTETPPPLNLSRLEGLDVQRLEQVVMTALEKEPAHRFQNATEFREALASSLRTRDPTRVPSLTDLSTRIFREEATPSRPLFKRMVLRLGLVMAGLLMAGSFVYSVSDLRRSRLDQAMTEMDWPKARRLVTELVQERPRDGELHMIGGHLSFREGDVNAALAAYLKALETTPETARDETFGRNVRALVESDDPSLSRLIETLGKTLSPASAPILAFLAREARSFSDRRQAYEGLELLDETHRLDRLDYLSNQLRINGTKNCNIRKWYVSRLIALHDPRTAPILRRELERKSGLFNNRSVAVCMEEDIRNALDILGE